jgi:hypothetical protein
MSRPAVVPSKPTSRATLFGQPLPGVDTAPLPPARLETNGHGRVLLEIPDTDSSGDLSRASTRSASAGARSRESGGDCLAWRAIR